LIAERGQKTLIIVHTQELLLQWMERCCNFLKVSPEELGVIGGGKFRIGRRISIGIINTVYNKREELKKEFGHIVVDECHRTPGKTFAETVNHFHAKYKLGLTATADRRDGLGELIFWYLGPIRHIVQKKYLVDEGYILNPKFIMRSTNFVPVTDARNAYTTMISELTKDYPRNALICQDVAKQMEREDFCGLIVSDRKEHCQELAKILKEEYDITALLLTGSTGAAEREKISNQIGDTQTVTIATGQLIGEGYDEKNLNTLFLATPIRYAGRITQYIGRIMRPAKGKGRPLVMDYVDWDVPQLRKSALGRMNVYGRGNVTQE